MKGGVPNSERVWCVHLPMDLKMETKIQSAKEGRQMYRIIEDALRAYLRKKGGVSAQR